MTHITRNPVFILVAPGFEETAIVHHLSALRQEGIPTALIGLSSRGVNGLHGIKLNPDYSLSDLKSRQAGTLVLIPGGRQCIMKLMADPRVHHLIKNTIASNGVLAVTRTAERVLPGTPFGSMLNGRNYLPQGDMHLNEFSDHLINLVA